MLITNSSRTNSLKSGGFFWEVLDWVYPPFCCNCNQIGHEVCPNCWDKLNLLAAKPTCSHCGKLIFTGSICPDCQHNPPKFDQLKSWASYEGVARSMLTAIKFQHRRGLIPLLIQPLVDISIAWKVSIDLVACVPLGRQRLHARGYNQSDLIAKQLAKKIHLPYADKALTRVRETHTQVGLNPVERQLNMAEAFTADRKLCQRRSILLIDDIATTGATLNACAAALREAGAEKIFCLTAARTNFFQNSNQDVMEVNI